MTLEALDNISCDIEPVADSHLANKAYVDAAVAAGAGTASVSGDSVVSIPAHSLISCDIEPTEDAHLVNLRYCEHVPVGSFFGFFVCGLAELDHGAEVVQFKACKADSSSDALHPDLAELALSVAHHLHIRRRGEACDFREFAPRESGNALTLLVVVQQILAKV